MADRGVNTRSSVGGKSPMVSIVDKGKMSKPKSSSAKIDTGKPNDGLKWIKCDNCFRWEVYDNTQLRIDIGPFDQEKLKHVDFSCDYCELKKLISHLDNENKELKSSTVVLKDQVDKLITENTALKTKVDNFQSTMNDLQRNLSEISSSNRSDKEELVALKTELEVDKHEVKNLINLTKSYKDAVREEATEIEGTSGGGNLVNNLKQLVKNEWGRVRRDDEDERNRRNNFIVFKVPESTSRTSTERQEQDMQYIKALIMDGLGIRGTLEISKLYRLGKRNENELDKPRPVLVRMNSETDKDEIMKNLSKLKSAEHKYKSLSVAHDLTPQQRANIKEKIQEVKNIEPARNNNPAEQGDSARTKSENQRIRVVGPPGKLRVIVLRN